MKTKKPTKKLETTIESFLPVFPGFYGTYFEPDEDSEIDSINGEYPEADFDFDDFTFDYDDYRESVCKKCVESIEEKLKDLGFKIKITYDSLYSPKEYNFYNDSINVTYKCSSATRKQIIKYLKANKEKFAQYCEDHFKSRDGFMSFMSYDVNDWLTEYQYEKLSTTFGCMLDFILKNEGYDNYQLYLDLDGQCYLNGELKPQILESFKTIKDYIETNYISLSTDQIIENLTLQFEDNDISDNITPEFINRMISNSIKEIEKQTLSLF